MGGRNVGGGKARKNQSGLQEGPLKDTVYFFN